MTAFISNISGFAAYIESLLPTLGRGFLITLKLFIWTLALSLPLGLLVSLIREGVSAKPTDRGFVKVIKAPIRFIISLYLWVFRGTPLMLQLFFFYFGLPFIQLPRAVVPVLQFLHITVRESAAAAGAFCIVPDAFTAALVAFTLNYAAYFAEIFRGGIIGVNKGQYEASKALGLGGIQTMVYIVVPQMIRTVIPPIANETIVLVKDTALAYSISLVDLMTAAKQNMNKTMRVDALIIAAVVYLVITLILTLLFNMLEKRLSISVESIH